MQRCCRLQIGAFGLLSLASICAFRLWRPHGAGSAGAVLASRERLVSVTVSLLICRQGMRDQPLPEWQWVDPCRPAECLR